MCYELERERKHFTAILFLLLCDSLYWLIVL